MIKLYFDVSDDLVLHIDVERASRYLQQACDGEILECLRVVNLAQDFLVKIIHL